jgi:cytochrome P450
MSAAMAAFVGSRICQFTHLSVHLMVRIRRRDRLAQTARSVASAQSALKTHRGYYCMGLDCQSDRKIPFIANAIPFERLSGELIRIRGLDLARQILRSDGFRQAGFMAELATRFTRHSRAPVLFQEGEAHRKQRSATARFFAPRAITARYRQLIVEESERLMDGLTSTKQADLSSMSMELSVAVTAEIVGLTDTGRLGLTRRLNSFLAGKQRRNAGKLVSLVTMVLAFCRVLRFFLCDVMPAIRSRRMARQDDLITELIDQGCSNREILTECITYGVAGIATTRELIVMAAWHLFDRSDLRTRFLDGDESDRIALLEEVLRLEPVVGVLYRRAEREIVLDDNGRSERIMAETLLEIDIRNVNVDREAAGFCPHRLDPDRRIRDRRMPGSLMSFGDGPHRCPGAAVALQESAIFLERLFRIPGIRLASAPAIQSNPLIESYELRCAIVACT